MLKDLTKQEIADLLNTDDAFDYLEPCIVYEWGGKRENQYSDSQESHYGKYDLVSEVKSDLFPINSDNIKIASLKGITIMCYHSYVFVFKDRKLFKLISVYERGNVTIIPEMDLILVHGKEHTISINTDGIAVKTST